jgi:hypothetical protein
MAQDEGLSLQNDSWSIAILTELEDGELHWDNDLFLQTELAQLVGFSFANASTLNQDSEGCDNIDCFIEKAKNAEASYVIFVPYNEEEALTLYNPETQEIIQSFMMENTITILGSLVDTILDGVTQTLSVISDAPSEVDSFAVMMPDSGLAWTDSSGTVYTFTDSSSYAFASDSTSEDFESISGIDVSSESDVDYERLNSTSFTIKQRFLRTFSSYQNNPSNLAHKRETYFTFGLPSVDITASNNVINQGIIVKFLNDDNGFLDDAEKASLIDEFTGKTIKFRNNIDLPTLIGLQFGAIGVDVSAHVDVSLSLPGDLLALPFSGLTFENPVSFDQSAEILNYIRVGASYGQEVETKYGNLRAGASAGIIKGVGYAHYKTDHFVLESSMDSLSVSAAATAIVTDPNFGQLADPQMDKLDMQNLTSNTGFTVDLGAGYDFYPLLGLELDVNVALKNLFSTLTFEHAKVMKFSADSKFENVSVAVDSMTSSSDNGAEGLDALDYLFFSNEEVVNPDTSISVGIPTTLFIAATFQPLQYVLLQGEIETGFSEGFNTEKGMRTLLMAHFYPISSVRISTGFSNYFGSVQFRGGFGLQFKNYDFYVDLASVGNLSDSFRGIQFMLSSSIYLF